MPYKQVLFRSEARERILRGASMLAYAVRVTLNSKCVLIQAEASALRSSAMTASPSPRNWRAEGCRGEPGRPDAAAGRGAHGWNLVGDGTSGSTVLAHAMFADGVRNVVAGASAIDLKRGLVRAAKARSPP